MKLFKTYPLFLHLLQVTSALRDEGKDSVGDNLRPGELISDKSRLNKPRPDTPYPSSKSPTASSKSPTTSSKSPTTSSKSPTTSSKSPTTSSKSPTTSSKSPTTSSKSPTPVPAPFDCLPLEIILDPDQSGCETSWDVTDPDGNVILAGGPYESNTTHIFNYCLPPQCDYTFTIYDIYGDGLDDGQVSGYSVTYDEIEVASRGNFNFGYEESTNFGCVGVRGCVDSPTNIAILGDIPGCTLIGRDPERFCADPHFTAKASHCPKTCSTCLEYGCEDSEVVFAFGPYNRLSCVDIPDTALEKACAKTKIRETCRGTCNYCEYGIV